MNAKEKVAYLKGLLDGVTLDESKPETKIIKALADALDCFAEEIAVLTAKAEKAETSSFIMFCAMVSVQARYT